MLAGIVHEAANRFGARPALVAADYSLSYGELDELSDSVAGGLAAEGIGAGDVIALVVPSSPDYVVAYVAAAKLGAVTTGVNPRLAAPERSSALELIGPDLVVATGDLVEGTQISGSVIPVEMARVSAGVLDGLRRAALEPSIPAEDSERPVAIVLTSGTTGTPRGAVFADRQLEAIGRMDAGEGWGGGGPMLASTELVHIGFMTKLPWYLRRGMTIHLLRKWRAADALRVISEERITTVGAIAAQVALMLREPEFDRYDLSSVQTIVAGGGPSPPALIREAKARFGAGYSVRYSSTESGGVGTMTEASAEDETEWSTVGRPRVGVDVAIRDDHGRTLPPGETGEVWIRSPSVMAGYWKDPEGTAETLVDGWLRTDDMGSLDLEGRVRLAGRRSEMYIRGGYNVYPLEVEAALTSHPAVLHAGVAPRPDPVMGEVGIAVVVPKDPAAPPTLEELRSFAANRLAHHKLPENLLIVDELPLTSIHKLDRSRLRRLAAHIPSPARAD
jgi:acyl-CoA synthetase (AMP-forming)/AMP-acid ligase II